MRFRLGFPQVIGGWESLTSTLLTGVCRACFPWTDNTGLLNIAFGTHSNVELFQGGSVYDITPYGPPVLLGSGPLGTTNGTARVDVTEVAHGYTTGISVKVFGAVAVGGITPNGTFAITVDTVDTFHFTFSGNATSTATGGGTAVVITPQTLLPAGAIDGTGGAGYGTGGYGVGGYSLPSAADFFPRTWDFAAWGQNLVGGPRFGGFYQWSNVTANRMVAIDGAPTQITARLVAPMNGGYMAFALGCNQETSGVFNPMCIRHSSVRNLNQWTTLTNGSTSREYILTGGGEIVTGRMIGPYLGVWTTDSFWLANFTGALNQPWNFQRQGTKCGLIGPNAVVVVGQTAFWISPDRQFHTVSLGGQPDVLPCPIRADVAEFLAASQGDKVMASSNAEFSEIRFDYPDSRDGYENSRYVVMGLSGEDAGAWSRGIMARTAYVDAGASLYPIGVTYEGQAYYHERGNSADGNAFAWFIRTAAQLVDVDWRLMVRSIWPDFREQVGPIWVSVTAREHPQGEDTTVTADSMAPNDMKADLMVSGRLFQVEFSGNSAPTGARIGKPVFDVERAGKM